MLHCLHFWANGVKKENLYSQDSEKYLWKCKPDADSEVERSRLNSGERGVKVSLFKLMVAL